jgi:hypothetical protein
MGVNTKTLERKKYDCIVPVVSRFVCQRGTAQRETVQAWFGSIEI